MDEIEGVFRQSHPVSPMPVTPHDFPEIRWRGHWIWVSEEPVTPTGFWTADGSTQGRETNGLFRRSIHRDRKSIYKGQTTIERALQELDSLPFEQDGPDKKDEPAGEDEKDDPP